MNRVSIKIGEFARRGFESPDNAAWVWQDWCARLGTEPPVPLQTFTRTTDRDQTPECMAGIGEWEPTLLSRIAANPGWLARVLLVLGGSPMLAWSLVKNPMKLEAPASEPGPQRAGWWDYIRAHAVGDSEQIDMNLLHRTNHAVLVQVTARGLASEDPMTLVDDIASELGHLADTILEYVLGYTRVEMPGSPSMRIVMVTMGKAGAEELSYISDVDVIHTAEPVEGVDHEEAMEVRAGVVTAMARVCSAHISEGTIWPVDATLRPEGNVDSLVRSLASCTTYYGKWAKNWESQALLKARPAAGDQELGQAFCDMVSPFVWEVTQRSGFLPNMHAMRNRVIPLIPAKEADREIKLGVGGLRDTEFTVQLLQFVHGRGDGRVRARSTFEALRALVTFGYIGRSGGTDMARAYRVQRVLEHRVQPRRLRRTHLMPDDEPGWIHLACTTGRTPDEVRDMWRGSARAVGKLQQRIFFSPLLNAVSAIPTMELRPSADAAQERLRMLGFEDAHVTLGHIRALTNGSTRVVEIQRQPIPAVLNWLAEGPNPDYGLLAFRRPSGALGTNSWYLRALRGEGWAAQRLARIASSNRYTVSLLIRIPEMVQMLASSENLELRPRELPPRSMNRDVGRASDETATVASVRALRHSKLCRVALADVLGAADVTAVGLALSDLTGATLDAAPELARREVEAPPVGVIDMGRRNGYRLGYASDTDAMFVVSDGSRLEEQVAAARLVRLACDLVRNPGPDPVMVVDTGLHPGGRGGSFVRTVSSRLTYYTKWSSVWKTQALLRARPVAGEQELASAIPGELDGLRCPDGGLTTAQVADIHRLKSRIETEHIPRGMGKERHLELESGSLSDVEWAVQLLQLQRAGVQPTLHTSSTLQTIDAAEGLELPATKQATGLREGWLHVSQVRNTIILMRGRPGDALPVDYQEQSTVAEPVGYDPGQRSRLVDNTIRITRRVSRVVNRVFWDEISEE